MSWLVTILVSFSVSAIEFSDIQRGRDTTPPAATPESTQTAPMNDIIFIPEQSRPNSAPQGRAPLGQALNNGCLPQASTEECQVFHLVNHERRKRNLSPLTMSATCQQAAKESSDEMLRRRSIGHFLFDELARKYRIRRENVAMGQRSAQEVMESWMNSTGHRRSILARDIRAMGVSLVRGQGSGWTPGWYWTQCFI